MLIRMNRGLVELRAPRSLRAGLCSVIILGFGVATLLGGNLATLAFQPKPRINAASTKGAIKTAPGLHSKKGALVICGGGHVPDSVWDRFYELAGGSSARIVVIPSASPAYAESQAALRELDKWKDRGVTSVRLLHTRSHEVANDPKFYHPLTEATGVWICGGAQLNLADAYLGTAVEKQLKVLLERGGVIGGTSAGAAIMSRIMIAGGKQKADVRQGFDLLPGAIVDQHFLRRNRVQRLLDVVAANPDQIGLGVDEQTAMVIDIHEHHLSVIGQSYVVACVPDETSKATRVQFLKPGDEADLTTLRAQPVIGAPLARLGPL